VGEEEILDLGRVRVEPADDEHVLDTPGDLDVSPVIHDPHISGVQPAVGIGRRRGGVGSSR
jgi:hypothetical protein